MEEQKARGTSQRPRAGDTEGAGASPDPPSQRHSKVPGWRLGSWAPSPAPDAWPLTAGVTESTLPFLDGRCEQELSSPPTEHTTCNAFRHGRSLRRTQAMGQHQSKGIFQLRTSLRVPKLHLGSFLLKKKKPFIPLKKDLFFSLKKKRKKCQGFYSHSVHECTVMNYIFTCLKLQVFTCGRRQSFFS